MYPATMASADFSLRPCGRRPFRREASSPQVRTRSFTAQPPDLRDRSLTTKSFAAMCLLALIGRASLSGFCPSAHGFALRFLSTLGRPCAVALRFARCGQLTGGLSPPRSRPCWAHTSSPWLKPGDSRSVGGTGHFPFEWLTLHRPCRPRRERSYLASTSRHPEPQGQNIPGSVDVRVGLIPARHTAEVGLALARLRCTVATARTGLRRIRGRHGDDAAPVLSPVPVEDGSQPSP